MNILIGCNGGLTGIYLSKLFRNIPNIRIVGANNNTVCCGKEFVDKQLFLPSADSSDFVESLIKILNDEKIDFYFPTHSKEMRCVSLFCDELSKRTKSKFLVSDKETFEALDNKRAMNINLTRISIPTPKLVTDFECNYPIVMKRDVGSGGSGLIEIINKPLHMAYIDICSDASFYEKINGKEYTADCLFDADSKLIGINQRVREKTMGGAVIISKTDNSFNILQYITKISEEWNFKGCVNFQYIVSDGIPYFIDVNLRFPSGGLPLTVEQGFNIPKLMLDIMEGRKVSSWVNVEPEKRMYRYFEERFEQI